MIMRNALSLRLSLCFLLGAVALRLSAGISRSPDSAQPQPTPGGQPGRAAQLPTKFRSPQTSGQVATRGTAAMRSPALSGRAAFTLTNVVPGELVVKLKASSGAVKVHQSSAAPAAAAVARAEQVEADVLAAVLAKHPGVTAQRAFGRAKRDPAVAAQRARTAPDAKRDGLFRWYRLRLTPGTDAAQVLDELKREADIEFAEPVYTRRPAAEIPPIIKDIPDTLSDPDIGQQWHLAAVHAQAAWNHLKQNGVYPGGSRDVVVAVIDTGVDYHHPELVGNIWTNAGEIPDNNLDDDGNGFADDIHGCSVVSDARSHAGDPIDLHGHGTHVAGIIAAQAYNHQGGVGVAFNVQIMAIRAAQYSGNLTTTDIAEGILYAIDNGAEVINMSFGGYRRSQIEEDALEVALSQAVLVAAAGNDGLNAWQYPCYPAALSYVHGVMATTADSRLAWFTNTGYDLGAPGEGIFSTLPENQYEAWSGTSMAAPVVSGIAALMRSYFWQREIYSTRFLMGGLWAASVDEGGGGTVVNAYRALTELPAPGVTILDTWLFDDRGISARNDADGRVDSGETIHLAIEVMNRSGQANHVVATLAARSDAAVFDDPHVTILTNTVDYGGIGPFNTADNGFIYDAGGVIRGVERPLVFQVATNCPNDHIIPFVLTITFEDGWNPENPGPYTRISRFNYIVQRGKNVPRVISTNTVLTADEYWMVASPVLIEPGVTLTIGSGTQVQWGGISDDPYNAGPQSGNILVRGRLAVQGTSDRPVALFPSYLVAGQLVEITVQGGTADLTYATVRNPYLSGMGALDHVDFDWDFGPSMITATQISNSRFHKLRGGGQLSALAFDRCLFDASWLAPTFPADWRSTPVQIRNCTFLQDNENDRALTLIAPVSTDRNSFGGIHLSEYQSLNASDWQGIANPVTRGGYTYALLPAEVSRLQEAELLAQYFGGHLTSVADQEEQDFLESYVRQCREEGGLGAFELTTYLGLSDEGHPGDYLWLDGSPLTFTHWAANHPTPLSSLSKHLVAFSTWVTFIGPPDYWVGTWHATEPIGAYRSAWGMGGYGGGPVFILKLPGVWTEHDLNAPVASGALLNYVRQRMRGEVIYNAFLNKYWDPNVNRWMRIRTFSTLPRKTYAAMNFNYWGTATTELIDHLIVDYFDDFTSSVVDYLPAPTNGFSTTYPFVERVLIDGAAAETVPLLSIGRSEFTVTFNRDMNTNVEPFVTFGPAPPHTDFTIAPRDEDFHLLTNGWLNPRTWHGSVWITPVTGEGYQLMRLSGAVAADDPWLVSGYDVGRFRFEVRTMKIAAMTLQASGQEGAVRLTWQQNDYDLLAGYNLYRAGNAEGPWTRLNNTVIPAGHETYLDTNVTAAVPQYYKFSVLTTDFVESDYSNLASAAALDTVAPVLEHAPVVSAAPGRGVRIAATITDNVRVQAVAVLYRAAGTSGGFVRLNMVNSGGATWSATIPGSAVVPPGVEYYVVASDGLSEVASGSAALPHLVQVSDAPSLASVAPGQGPSTGGTPVTLAGTLFGGGATVLFGGVLASHVEVLSANQLTCVTPAHFPATVDVQLVNTNGTQTTLLNGFRYEAVGAVVSLPAVTGDFGGLANVEIQAANLDGLRAAELVVTFNPAVVRFADARLGTLCAGWALSASSDGAGRVSLALASATAVSGTGSLAALRFEVVGAPATSCPLTLESVTLNDGALSAGRQNGQFTVNGFFKLAGSVRYFVGDEPVPGAFLNLGGNRHFEATTDPAGSFLVNEIPTGAYVLTASKTNDVREITGYDASLVLQTVAGSLTLTPYQRRAADVNRNGAVTAMDAAYILEAAVGLLPGMFPGAGRWWDFDPAQRDYAQLNADQTGQDFVAVLLGDVSGNWTPLTRQTAVHLNDGGPAVGAPSPGTPPVLIGVDNGVPGRTGPTTRRVLLKADVAPVYGVDMSLTYTPAELGVSALTVGELATAAATAINTNQAGVIRISVASARPLGGNGPLLLIEFPSTEAVDLRLNQVSINEGSVVVETTPSADAFDSDGDGLIDADELARFQTNPAKADSDGDGMLDGQEALAGTDPTDPQSVLRAQAFAAANDGAVTLTWASVRGRRYQVEATPDLRGASWSPLGGVITATESTTTFTPVRDGADRCGFYRVRLIP